MTDREPLAPAETPRPLLTRPRCAAPSVSGADSNPNALLEAASQGDSPPMSAMLATRPHVRPTTEMPQAPPADPIRAWLARLPVGLPAFARTTHEPGPLAPAEAFTACHAAACPDLFLIHAPDLAAGERVISEVARLSHGRILVLSPDPAAADRIAERLAKATTSVVRALADDENPIRPSPIVAKMTSAALGAGQLDRLKREAAAAIATAETQLRALDRFTQLASLDAEIADLTARLDHTEQQVRAEYAVPPAPPGRRERETRLAALREHQAATAKKPGLFARLLGKAKTDPHPADTEKEIHTLEADIAAFDAAASAERELQIAREVEARRSAAASRLAELTSTRDRLRAEVGGSPAVSREAAEQQLATARARANELADPDMVRRLLAAPRIVVGTPGSLTADPVFDQSTPPDNPPFGLLALDRAEELTEPDFVRLAKLATRWVLVGDAASHPEPRPHLNGVAGRNIRPTEVPFAARLARHLDRETWAREADRLVCRLVHPTADERRAMTREPLLDRPEIELRFVNDPDGAPVLAEVAFPAGTPAAEAKFFLFHEIGEVLLRPCGQLRWKHTETAITVSWPAAEYGINPTDAKWIDLEAGVREKVVGVGPGAFTAAVAFDPSAGWDADKAAAWLADHLPTESANRFATLPVDATPKRR